MIQMRLATGGWPVPEVPPLGGDVVGKSILTLLLDVLIGQPPAILAEPVGHRLFVNLVRLSDKAVSEYEAARLACQDFRDNRTAGRLSPYFRAIDHFENCINAVHRALLHADSIRSDRQLPTIDRTTWRSLHDAITRLNSVRDAIEHTEAMLRDGTLGGDNRAYLHLEAEMLIMGPTSILYRELRSWIRTVHGVMYILLSQPPEAEV